MERRASKRVESLRASQRIECLLSPRMDRKLWGNLPGEVLEKIYRAVVIRDFYKLRVVCKEWNNVACERRCFGDPVPKPYFLLVSSQRRECSPTGVLAYNVASGRWIWRLVGQEYGFHEVGSLYESFVVEGVLFDRTAFGRPGDYSLAPVTVLPQDLSVGEPQNLLFDVQIDRVFKAFKRNLGWRRIPEAPRIKKGSILGMMVDTSRRPCTYKLIVGNCNAGTQVLDSRTNTWEPKPSRMVRCRLAPCRSASPKSCVQCDGRMYVWSESDEIQVYSLEEDEWSTLNAPPRHASDDEFRGLGHWQSELYAVSKNEHGTLSVWKLVNRALQEWSEFERIPSGLYSYLLKPGAVLPIVAAHCNEYLLMHVLTDCNGFSKKLGDHRLGRRYVIFNISNKRWEIVALPYAQLWR
jgi:hypothetical protein